MAEEITGETSVCTVKYQWVINYDCFLGKNVGEVLKSPVFETHFVETLNWQLELYPNGLETKKNVFAIYLNQFNNLSGELNIPVSFKMIVNNKGEKIKHVTFERVYCGEYNGRWEFLFSNFLQRDLAEKNSEEGGGKLSIVCKMILGTNEEEANFGKHRQLNVDLEQLINDKEFSDVKFTFGNKELRAHKSILSGRSPYFANLFRNKMKEKQDNKIEIVDVKHEIFLEMLRYIYAEKVNDIEKIAGELLAAADKFTLGGLKLMCEQSLIGTMDADNVLKNLLLAYLYDLHILKVECIYFIVTKAADIVDKPEFRRLPCNIICDVCSTALADKKKS